METAELGRKYDRIAAWWDRQHHRSRYGVPQLRRALAFAPPGGKALDVGCGAGGRLLRRLQERGFAVTGLDVSPEMIRLARRHHPGETFLLQDIATWETDERFDFVLAWDSIFHLPLTQQAPVVAKLCRLLAGGGVMLYTFGDDCGEHVDEWRGDRFPYSSIGIDGNLQVLLDNGVTCKHLELDQPPYNHVHVIGVKA